MKTYLKYLPHGINSDLFKNVSEFNEQEITEFNAFKKQIFGKNDYDFVIFWNSRNIRRKSTSDLLLAYKYFLDTLTDEQIKKCAILLHTQVVDNNGTDLQAVKDMLFGNDPKYNIMFSTQPLPVVHMKYLYNLADVTALVSSNEGWGLSLTESMMCGTMILGNVTGGMQDQMRFEDEKGNWIKFSEDFPTNHKGKYKKCGEWAVPVFPSNISLVGSPATPYIYDDRCAPEDIALALKEIYGMSKEERVRRGKMGREWVTSSESRMSLNHMAEDFMSAVDHVLDNFESRPNYTITKVEERPNKHYNKVLI